MNTTPTQGRTVKYRKADGSEHMAFITKVWSGNTINVTLLEDNGGGAMMNNITSATLATEENPVGWFWPVY